MEKIAPMNNGPTNIILFTGQSGIKIQKCLYKLKDAVIFSVEDEMKRISNKDFLKILSEPPRIQEDRWTKAFKGIKGKLPAYSESQKYVFITFHASYYHQEKTEFVSPIDFKKLRDLKNRIKMIIVFIDDCYDIYKRLMYKGQMYNYILKLPARRALLQSMMNLITILEWREIETAFSRKISQFLEVPLFIVAVKHPTWMLSRLIESYEKQNIFYLSHPISSILKAEHPRPSGFYGELNEFIEKVLALDNVILFMPATIDEKKIKQDKKTKKYIPELSDGWPLPFSDDWLFNPLPSKVKGINPLNPLDFDFYSTDKGTQSAISSLLENLLEKIGYQINSRDRSLVEQSKDGVVVYRPYWAAVTPGGVAAELEYNFNLRTYYNEEKRRVGIISTHEDLAKWRIKRLFTLVKGNISVENTHGEELDNICGDWLNDPNKISKFLYIDNIKKSGETIRRSLEAVLPKEYEFKKGFATSIETTLRGGNMYATSQKKEKCWEKIINQTQQKDPFLEYTSKEQDIYLSCPKEEFDQKLTEFIKNFCKKKNINIERR